MISSLLQEAILLLEECRTSYSRGKLLLAMAYSVLLVLIHWKHGLVNIVCLLLLWCKIEQAMELLGEAIYSQLRLSIHLFQFQLKEIAFEIN